VMARILATAVARALRRLVEYERPLLLMSVGTSIDLHVGRDGKDAGWHDFCAWGILPSFGGRLFTVTGAGMLTTLLIGRAMR